MNYLIANIVAVKFKFKNSKIVKFFMNEFYFHFIVVDRETIEL